MAATKLKNTLASRHFPVSALIHRLAGRKIRKPASPNILLGHEPVSIAHKTPGHDNTGGQRAPPLA